MFVGWIIFVIPGFTYEIVFGYNVVFILGYNDGEVLGFTARFEDWKIVVIDKGMVLSSLFSSTIGSNDGNTEVSLLVESLVSDDGSAICSSGDFFYVTIDVTFVGWIIGLLLECTDGLVFGYNVGFILGSTYGKVLGSTVGHRW